MWLINWFCRALKIGIIHNILKERSLDQLDRHFEVAETLLGKIEQILNEHVKHDITGILSKEELQALIDSKDDIEAISEEIKDIPDPAAENLKEIRDFQAQLHRILEIIDETTKFVNDSQKEVLESTSKIMDSMRWQEKSDHLLVSGEKNSLLLNNFHRLQNYDFN